MTINYQHVEDRALLSSFDDACKLLYVWSPWLMRFVGNVRRVLTDRDDVSMVGVYPATIVVSRHFMKNSSTMEIAQAIEYACYQLIRHADSRIEVMRESLDDDSASLPPMAMNLEIITELQSIYGDINSVQWAELVARDIDERYVDVYDARMPPRIPDDAWVPETFGFPRGKNAESYIRLLIDKSHDFENQWLESHDISPQRQENENSSSASHTGETSPDVVEGESGDNRVDSTTGEAENGSEIAIGAPNNEDAINNRKDDTSRSHGDIGGINGVPAVGGNSGSDSNHPSAVERANSGSTALVDDAVLPACSGDTERTAVEPSAHSEHTAVEAASLFEGDRKSSKKLPDPSSMEVFQPLVDVMRAMDDNHTALLSPGDVPVESAEDIEQDIDYHQVYMELAEDINDYQSSLPPSTTNTAEGFTAWSRSVLGRPHGSWKKVFTKILRPIMTSAIMSGVEDMSYARRNPNQKSGQPLMMGHITYPPNVTVVVDASPSMTKYHREVMEQFAEVAQSAFISYAMPITVAIADGGVRDAITTTTIKKKILKAVARTYHGTSYGFGDTLLSIMKKGVRYKGRSFPRPDIMVVLTDCLFDFPWPDKKSVPSSCGKIIIVSVKPYDEVADIVPPWIKNNKNFLFASTKKKVRKP